MNATRKVGRALLLGMLLTALGGCAGVGVGVDVGYRGTVGPGYYGGYYEPYGYPYGGWGTGYRVGPPRGGVHRVQPGVRPYRPAPPNRRTPSLPSRPRR